MKKDGKAVGKFDTSTKLIWVAFLSSLQKQYIHGDTRINAMNVPRTWCECDLQSDEETIDKLFIFYFRRGLPQWGSISVVLMIAAHALFMNDER